MQCLLTRLKAVVINLTGYCLDDRGLDPGPPRSERLCDRHNFLQLDTLFVVYFNGAASNLEYVVSIG
jgi:hypothetical protein